MTTLRIHITPCFVYLILSPADGTPLSIRSKNNHMICVSKLMHSNGLRRFNMHIVTLHSVWILLVAMTGVDVQGAGPPITCEAGTFIVGEPASITCNFRVLITSTERPINMARYPSDAPRGAIGTDVLLCRWSAEKRKHDCFTDMANYTFDGILTDHLTVKIPAASFEHTGLYMCFFVPSEGTDPHPCELRVQAKPKRNNTENTNTGEPEESQAVLPIVLPCVIVVLVGVCIAGLVLFMRRRRANRARKSMIMELRHRSKTTKPLLPDEKQQVDKLSEVFQLSQTSLQKVVNVLEQEMQAGLHSSTQRSADTGMFRTFVSPLPTASELGYIMVFQLRSDRLTIELVIIPSSEAACPSQRFSVPKGVANGIQLFDFIADKAEQIVKENFTFLDDNRKLKKAFNKNPLQMPVAFVFAFPCKHETISKAYLTKWTKELDWKDVVCKDLKEMLQQAFKRKKRLNNLEIVAIVNDTVSTLVSAACSDPQCKVALHVGNGLNACYVEYFNTTGAECPDAEKQIEVINTELGGLWNEENLDYLRTVYDRELDDYSANPGSQSLEKMVSWMYIGEIVRLVLKRLFPSVSRDCDLFKQYSFCSEYVMIIERDTEDSFDKTANLLLGLGIEDCTDEDLKVVRDVCRLVYERSASLAAAGLAALINHVNQPEVTIVVDGILCRSYPHFLDLMHSKTLQLVKPGLTFSLVSPSCDRSIGAARIAAASLRLRNTKKSNK
ncbi:hexokinase type 2-like [Littorina saxatilis]|uniref:hexokinase type 2-like n=1 Tax=Littorina saxatilis TaxID=31220 RepID=UPI0038B552BF